jgi:hypothetical protein
MVLLPKLSDLDVGLRAATCPAIAIIANASVAFAICMG